MFSWIARVAAIFFVSISVAQATEPLVLEAKIALGSVAGRVDHLAIDLTRQRLFVAELGNNSVGVVDLKEQKLIQSISGLREPQGVGYHRQTDTLYAANAGDGSVRLFRGPDYLEAGRIDLGADADNIRLDATADRIVVGYGTGALAVLDPKTRRKVADIPLKAHPEGFQVDVKRGRIFANVPNAREISVIDLAALRETARWPLTDARSNFPMVIDGPRSQVVVAFRSPAKLRAYSTETGKPVNELELCGDSDDVFFDAKRKRLYASCGAGFIDVIDASGVYKRLAHIQTAAGARTSLYVPELDRLFVAVRASWHKPAAIWVFRPTE